MSRFDLSSKSSLASLSSSQTFAIHTHSFANSQPASWHSLALKALVLGLLVFAVAIANSAKAQDDTLDYWLLAKYDANGDRTISVEEISRKRERVFSMMDGNADGEVSLEEYQWLDIRKREMIVAARFNKLDLDGDGKLTGEEYTAYAGAFFDIDSDGNGKLSAQEIKKLSQERATPSKANIEHKCIWRFCYKAN